MNKYYEKIKETLAYLKRESENFKPKVGIILGSGLGSFVDQIEVQYEFSFNELPNFLASTVEGHKGKLYLGKLGNKKLAIMQGRLHYYEGYPIEDVVLPVRVLIKLGIGKLIITNAAGGVNPDFNVGDLMIITDHINFTGINPLIGANNSEFGPRFPDMTEVYTKSLVEKTKAIAGDLDLNIGEGTYMWMTGPSYETPAEIRMAQKLGVSSIGMSTVPEAIVANHAGLDILGISCITNMAAGILDKPLDHKDVIETSKKVEKDFNNLLKEIVIRL